MNVAAHITNRSALGPAHAAPAHGAASRAGTTRRDSLSIRVEHACKRYGGISVLEDISLDVAPGEFLTLLGPSGSGKTTLLNILAGFASMDEGRVFFGDRDVSTVSPHQRDLGIVFQQYALFPHMNVHANVAFPLRIRKVAEQEIRERVDWALKLVQLDGLAQRPIGALSGGQKQRVALARAVVFEPSIILMDEPLSALDKQLRERMQIELRQLHDKLGTTTIYVTHDQREALTMSDRIAVMNHGRIVQLDPPRALYDEPADAFVADFIGESTLIPVEWVSSEMVRLGQLRLATSRPVPRVEELFLAVRTEKLLLDGECTEASNVIVATVDDVIFQGESLLLIARLPEGHQLTMRRLCNSPSTARLPGPGETVRLSLRPSDTVVVPQAHAPRARA